MWALCKLVKRVVKRGRPADVLADVLVTGNAAERSRIPVRARGGRDHADRHRCPLAPATGVATRLGGAGARRDWAAVRRRPPAARRRGRRSARHDGRQNLANFALDVDLVPAEQASRCGGRHDRPDGSTTHERVGCVPALLEGVAQQVGECARRQGVGNGTNRRREALANGMTMPPSSSRTRYRPVLRGKVDLTGQPAGERQADSGEGHRCR